MLKLFLISVALFGAANLSDVSYYEVLGVTKQASSQEIRQAYKKLAVKLHPDKNPNETEREKFLKITEAYETLKDQEKRHQYDLYGSQTTYSRKYDYKSQSEYDNLYYNGLYHNDPYVDTLSGGTFYNYLKEGFHFINFYSPFCPPCQSVAEDWKKLAEIYKGIVKVGAVNCKYHNSFCYNSMRIGSYPSLLFYPNGKNGNFVYYQGDRTLEALDKFVMSYLKSRVHVPTITQMRSIDKPMAYVLGDNRIDRGVLTRIAYQLNGLVTLAIVEDDNIRSKLTDDDYTTIVFKYKKINKEIQTTEEKDILQEIIESLPKVTVIDPVKIKDIRIKLRSGSDIPWVLYFARKGNSKLQLHQMKLEFPNMDFGEVNCDDWSELCSSLHVDMTPAWGVLKRGGGYQRAHPNPHPQHFIRTAARAVRLYSLSPSDLTRILDGDAGAWVLLIVPYKISWEHIVEPFTRTSLHYLDSEDLSFGIMTCTANSNICRQLAHNQPMMYLQNGTRRHTYNRRIGEQQLIEFIDLIRDSSVIELNERLVLDIVDPASRDRAWLVAFLPPHCNHCEEIAMQWNIVANKLRPLEFVRVGVLKCEHDSGGFCNNVRSPVAKLYPIASGKHYSVSLQHLSEAPYMLEWALGYIDDSIQKLNWNSFTKTVIAEELNPSGGKKPWLVYFHSPRCYRCYEMYADFAIAGFLLNNAVQLGKVNCISDRGLCQHEQITSYPSLKLYLSRNQQQQFSSVISIPVKEYSSLLQDIKPYLMKYDENILAGIDNFGSRKPFDLQHDEF